MQQNNEDQQHQGFNADAPSFQPGAGWVPQQQTPVGVPRVGTYQQGVYQQPLSGGYTAPQGHGGYQSGYQQNDGRYIVEGSGDRYYGGGSYSNATPQQYYYPDQSGYSIQDPHPGQGSYKQQQQQYPSSGAAKQLQQVKQPEVPDSSMQQSSQATSSKQSINVTPNQRSSPVRQKKLVPATGEAEDWDDNVGAVNAPSIPKVAVTLVADSTAISGDQKSMSSSAAIPSSVSRATSSQVGVSGADSAEEISIEENDESKIDTSKLKQPDSRPHLNVVFIGHVDAGKSTACGNILVLTDQVDPRQLEKYEREAKEKNRESWFYAFIVDINEEERQKGKTVEVGRATFELERTRFTILDAPGHKGFVPNMIGGAAQADVGVLIISARKGEFETGFEKGGQTREHAMLAKTLGVCQLIVAINKMDDPTCDWDQQRFREIEKKLTPFLRGCGYNPTKDIFFVPISGILGQNLKVHCTDARFKDQAEKAAWYTPDQPTLFGILDNLKPPERDDTAPLRIPLLEGYRDQGVVAVGKVEAGIVTTGQVALLMPKKITVKVLAVSITDVDVAYGKPGENVALRLAGVNEEQIARGSVLCSIKKPCPVVTAFKAQVIIVDLLEHRPLITAGYSCTSDECQISRLLEVIDRSTKKKKVGPQFVRSNSLVVCEIQLSQHMCLEVFDTRPQLGRFTLRDEGKTIAIGKVLEVLTSI